MLILYVLDDVLGGTRRVRLLVLESVENAMRCEEMDTEKRGEGADGQMVDNEANVGDSEERDALAVAGDERGGRSRLVMREEADAAECSFGGDQLTQTKLAQIAHRPPKTNKGK